MNKDKQIALITGASSGIGAEIAKQLAKKNVHTIITARSASRLMKTEKSIIDNGGTCTLVCLLYTSPSPRDGTKSRMPSSA